MKKLILFAFLGICSTAALAQEAEKVAPNQEPKERVEKRKVANEEVKTLKAENKTERKDLHEANKAEEKAMSKDDKTAWKELKEENKKERKELHEKNKLEEKTLRNEKKAAAKLDREAAKTVRKDAKKSTIATKPAKAHAKRHEHRKAVKSH